MRLTLAKLLRWREDASGLQIFYADIPGIEKVLRQTASSKASGLWFWDYN